MNNRYGRGGRRASTRCRSLHACGAYTNCTPAGALRSAAAAGVSSAARTHRPAATSPADAQLRQPSRRADVPVTVSGDGEQPTSRRYRCSSGGSAASWSRAHERALGQA